MNEQSPSGVLNKADYKKIAIGAGVALAGALMTYVSEVVTQVDFGDWTPLVVAGWGVIANIARKWIMDNQKSY